MKKSNSKKSRSNSQLRKTISDAGVRLTSSKLFSGMQSDSTQEFLQDLGIQSVVAL